LPTAWSGPSQPPYFFLSYARSDDDPYVEQFFRDLCAEVRMQAGLPSTAEVGFFDTHSIELGAPWSAELVRALAECRTFLALCSPRYVVSEMCGREWQLFSDRLEHYGQRVDTPCPLLMPVVWLPLRAVPAAVSRLQYDAESFGDAYRRGGLRQLMRLQRNRDDYLEALTALAERIVGNATAHPLPPAPRYRAVDLMQVVSPFHHPAERDAEGQPRTGVRADQVTFMVAAPDRREAATVRSNVEFYGDDHAAWAPYLPDLPESLASFARGVAAKRGLTARVLPMPAATRTTAGQPPPDQGIVVLLVDPWAPQIAMYRTALAEHEARTPAMAAMVPRNHQDPETGANWDRLSAALRQVFTSKVHGTDATAFRPDNLNHRTFDEDLQVVLEWARNRIFARSLPPAAGQPPPTRQRPILEGP
jgi:FxsC-like protein